MGYSLSNKTLVVRRIANFVIFLDASEFLQFWWFLPLKKKKSGFWVFLVHPSMASVLLSALVERCFVSLMRDFYSTLYVLCFQHNTWLNAFLAYCKLLVILNFFFFKWKDVPNIPNWHKKKHFLQCLIEYSLAISIGFQQEIIQIPFCSPFKIW